MEWNKKCRFFDERFACDTLTTESYVGCEECKFASPYSKKLIIIKLGAIGDVLRTTPILTALKKKYGENILIYWITSQESSEALKNNPIIDKILIYNQENILRLQQEKFDILFSLEIDTPGTLLANLIDSKEKFGYFFDDGATSCFNKGAEAYIKTAFINHIKLKNRRTYQDLIFEACELNYNKEKPIFNLEKKDIEFSEDFKIKNNISGDDKVIGINIGSASNWSSKFWDNQEIVKLVKNLHPEFKIIILSGPNEIDKKDSLLKELEKEHIRLISNNPQNSLSEFAAILNICQTIICGDTLTLHLASSLNKPVIALFFVTPSWEIEDYGLIKKIQSPLLERYFFVKENLPEIKKSISVNSILELLNKNK